MPNPSVRPKNAGTLGRWSVALDRHAQIRALVEAEAFGADEVVALACRLQVNRATVYRLIRKYRLRAPLRVSLPASPAGALGGHELVLEWNA